MNSGGYSQSLKVTFVKISERKVIIAARGIEKELEAEEEKIELIKSLNFAEGQLVQLLYTSKEKWKLKELNLDVTEELRYFRKDDV